MSDLLTKEEVATLSEEKSWPTELTTPEKALIDKIVKQHKPCLGTGRVGFDLKGKPIVCRCVWKVWARIITERKIARALEEPTIGHA